MELTIPRKTLSPKLQLAIENEWKKRPLQYVFNRYQVLQFTIGQNVLNWTSPVLFQSFEVPPLFMVFVQDQERSRGNFNLSLHKYELPGVSFYLSLLL